MASAYSEIVSETVMSLSQENEAKTSQSPKETERNGKALSNVSSGEDPKTEDF